MTIIHLEMTSPDQLVPGNPPPSSLELTEVGPEAAAEIGDLYRQTWEPLATGGRLTWSDGQWADELAPPTIHTWVATVHGDAAGFAELSVEPEGVVGIVVFGLVPTYQGRGFGAAFLTEVIRTAWTLADPTTRVWLQTSSTDHPHALPNYRRRGFQILKRTS
ncbi:ribosomal protein S18 acetylase RimI-like enzyme [Kribbella amoyensis]|uniref:Ribosomal protein S18 acetylase RimI-like enzyme n=1 Tax=Kribbella amoyensis TaxID=996641 RepID=A0A561BMF5_9ACTN|nr:GNAT family N-acetyltransferase [Kribbella amoyensis]TWD80002.1 ribosomal protein S18 acetylase RimI-like enzyme [Kribbella amoyensis]